jgi:hypothetical protein
MRAGKKRLVTKRFKWMSYCDFSEELLWPKAGSQATARMPIKVIYLLRPAVGLGV